MHLTMLKLTVGLALLSLVTSSACPNQQLCEDQQTCCLIQSLGQYNCCPFHQGECCEDHLHCCPEGMLCQTAQSMCSNSTHSQPWTERISAQKGPAKSFRMVSSSMAKKDNIICPDNSSCPAEFSCLKLDDKYSCCPVTQGIVCSDGKHCCSNDHECSVDSNSCIKKKETVQAVMCADHVSECPKQTSCCETLDGAWGCCPMLRAVCCDDKVHCCPEDTVCHVNSSKCVSSSKQEFPMWAKFPARLRAEWEDPKTAATQKMTTKKPETTTALKSTVTLSTAVTKGSDVPCNDTVACKDRYTCCKDGKGGWGCCPLFRAVCCDDFVHCCPQGTKCNLTAETCDDPSGSVPWLKKVPSRPITTKKLPKTKSYNVSCDGTTFCPDETTCCKNGKGGWGCCPLVQAVCCDDFVHCCPQGTKCNLAAGTCDDPSGSVPWLKKVPSRNITTKKLPKTKSYNVSCDDTTVCPDETTCCKNDKGGWGCCPLVQAVCCDDFIHCCPQGTKCNLAAETCDDPSGSVPWLKKVPSQPITTKKLPKTKSYNVSCDGTTFCPDETTCCKNGKGGWACCPLVQAVCCDDFVHCCPQGTKCNLAAGTCDDPSGSVPWLKKVPSRNITSKKLPETKSYNVSCDGTTFCPDETTCCKNGKGGWGCCPLVQAVCCDDFVHCCPQGTKCNLAAGTCDDPSGSVPWLKKVPSRNITTKKLPKTKSYNVSCDDTTVCPDETTCCKNDKGGWGCCPLVQAVCCDDFIHCCPQGTKCNLAAGTCDDPSGSVPWLKKVPSQQIRGQKVKAVNVSCDSSYSCPEFNTCCDDVDTDWSCCPFPKAVCCEDGLHCCPHDTICNFSTLTCDKDHTLIPMAVLGKTSGQPVQKEEKEEEEKKEKQKEKENKSGSVQCDEHTSCPDHTTCCLIAKTKKWGCCPLLNAVCCKDGEHCCPANYTCDKTQTSCIKGDVVIPWYNKLAAQSSPDHSADVRAVRCDSQTSCPIGATCCQLSSGQWGCCPLPEATCCSDSDHCCPKGFICDADSRSCVKSIVMNLEMVPLTKIRRPHNDIQCGGGFSCNETSTCCKTSKTTWGCCPINKAVCCSDMVHCCPAGTTCLEGGACSPGTKFTWHHWEVFFSTKKRTRLL